MKNKSKKKIILSILIALLLIGIISIYLLSNHNTKKEYFDYPKENRRVIKTCKDEECPYDRVHYDKLVFYNDYKDFQDVIEKINKETDKYYNMVKKSNTNGAECNKVKDKYYHSKSVATLFATYDSDKYVSVSVSRTISDLCNDSVETKPREVHIYDKKQKRILTQDEFIKEEKITDDEIDKAIKETLKKNVDNIGDKKIEDVEEIVLSYEENGILTCTFHIANTDTYMGAIIRESKQDTKH